MRSKRRSPPKLLTFLCAEPTSTMAGAANASLAGKALLGFRPGRRRLRGLRQRRRIIRFRVEVGDDVGPLVAARQAGEGHRSSGNETAWIGQEMVELLDRPLARLALHGGRIIEAGHRGPVASDHPVEVGPNPVRLAFVEGVTGLALLGRGL